MALQGSVSGIKWSSDGERVRSIAASALPHYDESMSFSETIFLFFLALIIFGPKKLPEIAQSGRTSARRTSPRFERIQIADRNRNRAFGSREEADDPSSRRDRRRAQ